MNTLQENFQTIQANIAEAARKSGRTAEDVTLIAVTKTISVAQIREAMALGCVHLGENKVQELLSKYDDLYYLSPEFHMIGHLQTNKIKSIIDKVRMIHSVDSTRLASEIDKHALRNNVIVDILVEVNIANEPSKHGVPAEEAEALLVKIDAMRGIRAKGLMCIAPFVENSEQNRPYFEKMRKLLIDIQSKLWLNKDKHDFSTLSMGMSNDYTVAVEEGATMVRIGTSLFGSRL